MRRVVLSRRAERDLRRIGLGEALTRLREAFAALAAEEVNLDVKVSTGSAPWQRLRVGEYRVLYRPTEPDEVEDPDTGILVARVVHRRDLERAVGTLE